LIELKAREGEREGSALVSNRAMKGGEGGTYLPPCLTLRPGVYRCIRESVFRGRVSRLMRGGEANRDRVVGQASGRVRGLVKGGRDSGRAARTVQRSERGVEEREQVKISS
jgi:hypothetical protein